MPQITTKYTYLQAEAIDLDRKRDILIYDSRELHLRLFSICFGNRSMITIDWSAGDKEV